jgi:hypothetical protein
MVIGKLRAAEALNKEFAFEPPTLDIFKVFKVFFETM